MSGDVLKDDFFNLSGTTHNHVRQSPPPTSARIKSLRFPMKISLENFDSEEVEGSRYVLTSPRSLEACAQVGIRPVDLLPKSLEEFEAELLPQGVELRTVREMFDQRETERLRNLMEAMDIRGDLIRNPSKMSTLGGPDVNGLTGSSRSRPPRSTRGSYPSAFTRSPSPPFLSFAALSRSILNGISPSTKSVTRVSFDDQIKSASRSDLQRRPSSLSSDPDDVFELDLNFENDDDDDDVNNAAERALAPLLTDAKNAIRANQEIDRRVRNVNGGGQINYGRNRRTPLVDSILDSDSSDSVEIGGGGGGAGGVDERDRGGRRPRSRNRSSRAGNDRNNNNNNNNYTSGSGRNPNMPSNPYLRNFDRMREPALSVPNLEARGQSFGRFTPPPPPSRPLSRSSSVSTSASALDGVLPRKFRAGSFIPTESRAPEWGQSFDGDAEAGEVKPKFPRWRSRLKSLPSLADKRFDARQLTFQPRSDFADIVNSDRLSDSVMKRRFLNSVPRWRRNAILNDLPNSSFPPLSSPWDEAGYFDDPNSAVAALRKSDPLPRPPSAAERRRQRVDAEKAGKIKEISLEVPRRESAKRDSSPPPTPGWRPAGVATNRKRNSDETRKGAAMAQSIIGGGHQPPIRFGISDGATTPRLNPPAPSASASTPRSEAGFQSRGARSRSLSLQDIVSKAVAKDKALNSIPRRRYETYAGYR